MRTWIATCALWVGALGCAASQQVTCGSDVATSAVSRWESFVENQGRAGFSGATAVGDTHGVQLSREYGDAARDSGPTAFWVASTSKAITATAMLRLVELGRVALEDSLATLLPDVPERWRAVTIHHLLSHRSGLPHAYAADGIANRDSAVRAILALDRAKPLGSFEYSNDGYSLLAILIEMISGESFETFVRKSILVPAGMTHAGFWGFEAADARIAPPANPTRSARTRAAIWRAGHSVPNWGYRGATGIYATPLDMYRFLQAFHAGRLVTPRTRALMIASKNASLPPNAQSYGYGWALTIRDRVVTEYWHRGDEDWLGHNASIRVAGTQLYSILSNAGQSGSLSWAARIEEGLRACSRVAF